MEAEGGPRKRGRAIPAADLKRPGAALTPAGAAIVVLAEDTEAAQRAAGLQGRR